MIYVKFPIQYYKDTAKIYSYNFESQLPTKACSLQAGREKEDQKNKLGANPTQWAKEKDKCGSTCFQIKKEPLQNCFLKCCTNIYTEWTSDK